MAGIDPDALQVLMAAGGLNDMTKLPIYYGVPGKDQMTAELWAIRVDTAMAGAGWNELGTMARVYTSLRLKAAAFHNFLLEQDPALVATWAAFRPKFIRQFHETQTTVSSIALFDGLKQRADENTLDFSLRVGRAIHETRITLPRMPVPDNGADIEGINDAIAAPAANAAHSRALYILAIDRCTIHNTQAFGAKFLLAGLRPDIRIKVTQIPNYQNMTLLQMSEAAADIERNMKENADVTGSKAVAMVEGSEAEVNGVRFGRGHGHRGGRGQSRGRGRGGRGASQGNRDGTRFNGPCYNCGKTGHKKIECRSAPRNNKVNAANAEDYADNGQVGSQHEYEFYEEVGDEVAQLQVGTLDYLN
jgi:ribosomal protein L15